MERRTISVKAKMYGRRGRTSSMYKVEIVKWWKKFAKEKKAECKEQRL